MTHLGDDVRRKLTYTLVEQLYAGAQRAISAISHNKPAPTTIQGTLEKLSILPTRIVEVKKSSARAGSLMALTRAKAWVPDFDPAEAMNGYPSMKEDGSAFSAEDLRALTKDMRPLASKLADEADLTRYHLGYDLENVRVERPSYDIENLIPPVRKHTFAPDIEPSELINDEVYFRALAKIDWSTPDFQQLPEVVEDPEQADPQSSQRAKAES